MLFMIVVLAACCIWVEMRVVNSCSPLGYLLERTKVGSAVFSLGLSVLLGMFFGAAGLIVFAAGVLSTVAIQPWYAMRRNGTLGKVHATKQRYKDDYQARRSVYARRVLTLWTGLGVIGKILLVPFMIIGWIMDQFERMSSR